MDELVRLGAAIIHSGIEEGTFPRIDPVVASQAILFATSRFHHPAHAMDWADPKLDVVYDNIWRLLMEGLSMEKNFRVAKKENPLGLSA